MKDQRINGMTPERIKEIIGILMDNTLYFELPLKERSGLIKYIFNLYLSKS